MQKKPEDFLELVERSKRGRLKIYIGSAAGVGKTYRMLEEAHAMRRRGMDVVIGFIETHNRTETQALVQDLATVPRKRYEYRQVVTEEMDLDAVIARRPNVAIVDELAHTNLPLCRNKKRYQDVLEILHAGINVISAFNIQHLESLNDLVQRITGVRVRETIPDSFLRQADQVVLLDLATEDLMERLQAGKIYAPDKIPWALNHFFRTDNLRNLRELALREVAERIDRMASQPVVDKAEVVKKGSKLAARIMVCLASYSPRAKALLYSASRLAGKLSTDWFVVHVETPKESPNQIDATAQRILLDNLEKARELGAEIVRLRAKDPVPVLLDFARSHAVGHLVIGRSDKHWLLQVLGQSVTFRLIREASGFDVHVVSLDHHREEASL